MATSICMSKVNLHKLSDVPFPQCQEEEYGVMKKSKVFLSKNEE